MMGYKYRWLIEPNDKDVWEKERLGSLLDEQDRFFTEFYFDRGVQFLTEDNVFDYYYLRRNGNSPHMMWLVAISDGFGDESRTLSLMDSWLRDRFPEYGLKSPKGCLTTPGGSIYWRTPTQEEEFWSFLSVLSSMCAEIINDNSEDIFELRKEVLLTRYNAFNEGNRYLLNQIYDFLSETVLYQEMPENDQDAFLNQLSREIKGQQWCHFFYNMITMHDPDPKYVLSWMKE